VRLTTQHPIGSNYLRHTLHFRCERAELVHHLVHCGTDSEELTLNRLAFDLQHHLLRQVAFCDRGKHSRDFCRRRRQIPNE
jgi:hypothetical protein